MNIFPENRLYSFLECQSLLVFRGLSDYHFQEEGINYLFKRFLGQGTHRDLRFLVHRDKKKHRNALHTKHLCQLRLFVHIDLVHIDLFSVFCS